MSPTSASSAVSPSRRTSGLIICAMGTLALLMVSSIAPVPSSARRALRWGSSIPAVPRATQVSEDYDAKTGLTKRENTHELTPEEYAAKYKKEHETAAVATPEEETQKYSSKAEEYLAEYKKHVAAMKAADDTEEALEEELDEAEEIIEDLEEDEEKLSIEEIEEDAERDGVSDAKLKRDEELLVEDASPLGEEFQELIVEEDEEKVIEEIVEEELGIEEFCFDCIWLGNSEYSCHDRVGYLKKVYKTTEDAAKLAAMNDGGKCSMSDPERVVGIWEHTDRGKLLGIKAGDDRRL